MNRTFFRPLFLLSILSAIVALSGCSTSTSPSSGGGKANLSVPTPVDFGVLAVGQAKDTAVLFVNTGSDSLTITSDALSSSEVKDTNFVHSIGLASGASKFIHIQFTPAAPGAQIAYDSIRYQWNGGSAVAVITFEANSSGGGGGGSGSLIAIPANINFGTLPIGQWHDTTISLVNSASLTINSSSVSSGEARDTNFSSPVQIAAPSITSIHIQFNPLAAGARSATDQITYTINGVSSSVTITLSATGTASTGGGGTEPKAGSTFTFAVDTSGVPQGDSTYTVVSNSLSYQGKANVLGVSGPTGGLSYSHVESNGDVSVYVDLSAISAQLISAGIFAVIPSQWFTIPLGSKRTLSSVLFDSTLTITGIPFPVQVIISDTSLYLGSSSVTAAGKSFQTNEGSVSVAINASVGGFVTLLSAENTTEIWYSNSLGYYPKRQDVSSNTQNTTGTGGTTTTTTTNYRLITYHEN